ncbi:MAG: universal stress protein, partial [Solirubrobacteraceae bacterium]|nr:universal stress protein [Solirubrobacteraceae bacterium]
MSSRFARVVIGVGRDVGPPSIELARLLRVPDAAVVLVHVVVDGGLHGVLPAVDPQPVPLDFLRAARRALGPPCEMVVHHASSVAAGLHEIAVRESADLIVVGPGHPERLHGVQAILHHAPCPVAVASRDAGAEQVALRRVGIAYLPTVAGRHGLAVAREVVAEHGGELCAITVVPDEASPWLGPMLGTVKALAMIDGLFLRIAADDLAALPDATSQVAEGDPVEELVRFSQGVDLLVVGAR